MAAAESDDEASAIESEVCMILLIFFCRPILCWCTVAHILHVLLLCPYAADAHRPNMVLSSRGNIWLAF